MKLKTLFNMRNLQSHEIFGCMNHKLEFVLYIIKNGHKRLTKQCLYCGEKEQANTHKLTCVNDINKIPLFSLDLWGKFKSKVSFNRRLYYDEKNKRFYEYINYMNSSQWQEKRKQVIKNYNGVCFYCLEPAKDVHHKHYDNFGNEPLSDLVLLCRTCHEQEHIENPNLSYLNGA